MESWVKGIMNTLHSSRNLSQFTDLHRQLLLNMLGSLSPIPFALITNTCLGWSIYALMTEDYFIFMSNCFPLVIGFVMCLTSVHILKQSNEKQKGRGEIVRLRVEGILVSCALFWICMAFILGFILRDEKHAGFRIHFVGAICDVGTLLFYGAPLLNIREVIEKKDSSTLYAPAIAVNLMSAILWFFYGLMGIKEMVVWIPSAVGISLCLTQLFICWYYPVYLNEKFDETEEEDYPCSDFSVFATGRQASMSCFIRGIHQIHSPAITVVNDVFTITKDDWTNLGNANNANNSNNTSETNNSNDTNNANNDGAFAISISPTPSTSSLSILSPSLASGAHGPLRSSLKRGNARYVSSASLTI